MDNNICKCGCSKIVSLGRIYVHGHNRKGTGRLNNTHCVVCGNLTKKYYQTCSKECYSKLLSFKRKNYIKNNTSFGKHTSPYNNINYRSSWEVEFAKQLDSKNIKFEYEKKSFLLSNGKRYFPDFRLKDSNLLIEIKGYYWGDSKQKIELFKEEYPLENLLVIETKPSYGWF